MNTGVTLPIIDAAEFASQDWLEPLDWVCREQGCFQLHGHGISVAELRDDLAHIKRFFALPREQKLALERSAQNAWGYFDRELTKNTRDWKEIYDIGEPVDDGPMAGSSPQWPADLDGFQTSMERLFSALDRVARRLLEGISQNLGMPAEYLGRHFSPDHSSFLRLNHYPPCSDPDAQPGISEHTDAGAVTVLLHDGQPGLQFKQRGIWQTARADADALIVSIGDIVQVWSNDRYPAPPHRVRASTGAHRYSAPFFLNPSYHTDYAPLPSVVAGSAPRYRSINWGEFRAGRAAGDYADLGSEIQISDFALE